MSRFFVFLHDLDSLVLLALLPFSCLPIFSMSNSVVVRGVGSRPSASCDMLVGRFCLATHSSPVATGTGVLWVSCWDPQVCSHIQGDVTAERQPAAVLLLSLSWLSSGHVALYATCGLCCNVGDGVQLCVSSNTKDTFFDYCQHSMLQASPTPSSSQNCCSSCFQNQLDTSILFSLILFLPHLARVQNLTLFNSSFKVLKTSCVLLPPCSAILDAAPSRQHTLGRKLLDTTEKPLTLLPAILLLRSKTDHIEPRKKNVIVSNDSDVPSSNLSHFSIAKNPQRTLSTHCGQSKYVTRCQRTSNDSSWNAFAETITSETASYPS